MEKDGIKILPKWDELFAVIGGHRISSEAETMAFFLGRAIVEAGYKIGTGGRRGAGESASRGAAEYCDERGLDFRVYVFAIVPWGDNPDFSHCHPIHAGKNTFERGLVLMRRSRTAFIVGGEVGTEHEIMHAAVDDYMAWGCANIMPVSGTGGIAERILKRIHPYYDSLLDAPEPSLEKAKRLIESSCKFRFPLFDFWEVNIHEGWQSGNQHPVVHRTYKIRHYEKSLGAGSIRIEGEK